jgi:hypothetical protein
MQIRQFLLGLVSGVFITLLGVATVVLILATRPSDELPLKPPAPEGDIVVRVSEAYLSKLATSVAREQEEAIQDVVVNVQPDNRVDLLVAVKVRVLNTAVGVNVGLVGTLLADEEGVRYSVLKVQLIGIGIPSELLPESLQAAFRRLEADGNRRVNEQLIGSGLVPVSAITDDSGLTITLRAA